MGDWTIRQLPFWGKITVSAFLCTVGVGYIFAMGQIVNVDGSLTYGAIVKHYYGVPAQRDSIDTYWAGMKKKLIEKWKAGDRGASKPQPAETTFSLSDLNAVTAPSSGMPDDVRQLLAQAKSVKELSSLVDAKRETDLQVTLGIPTLKSLVTLGHIHTFGHLGFFLPIAVLLLFTSLPWRVKGILATMPFVGIMFDYPSAIATRLFAPQFAIVLLAAGSLMALGYLAAFFVCMYDLWLNRR